MPEDTRQSDPHTEYQAGGAANPAANPMSRFLEVELKRLREVWSQSLSMAPPLPIYSWGDVQEAVLDLTTTPAEELLARGALCEMIRTAGSNPTSAILAEILLLGAAVRDPRAVPASLDAVENT